jgi:hypothetical protein
VLNVAMTGDPGPLDPTPVTSDLLSEITHHFSRRFISSARIIASRRCSPRRCRT